MCVPIVVSTTRDVSRVRHCVLGHARFSVGCTEYRVKGPLGRKQKIKCLGKFQMPGKTHAMRTAYFTTKLNISISHYGETIEFLKFQSKLLFLAFVVE